MDFAIRRDWAASSGGGEIVDFNGPDYTPFGCGPSGAIDVSQGTGWGSTAGDDAGTPTNVFVPKFIVVDMKSTVDVAGFAIDPTATCGDAGSASTGAFHIQTSASASGPWTTVASGTFTAANRFQYNEVAANAGASGRYVRFWIDGNQVPDFTTNCPEGNFSGCQFADLTELEVFGTTGP
jgi:extracellular elastinolytic metalloproteinase